ncbi:hypothetical protein [Oceanobacter mangrovi]|uniref:hypothetical protein n=1 Tax=Oceanobacter mangrovi TaxID=2862510 RepID=UPI001C8DD0F0|nr:hypothetical protein [Oceanobacter mangrovi]
MSDEDLDMHEDDMQDNEDIGDDVDDDSDDESGSTKAAKKAAAEEEDEAKSMTVHNELRRSLEDDVAAFLAKGGKIEQVEDNVMADPPRKPQSNYGSRPI